MKNSRLIYLLLGCTLSATSLIARENDSTCFSSECLTNQNMKILAAIEHLGEACEISLTIKNHQTQQIVFRQLRDCLDCFQKDYFSKNYDNAKETAITIHENIGEILECCQEEQVIEDIISCVNEMMDCFK